MYRRLIKPLDNYGLFEYWGHPVCQAGKKTMAWVRIDFTTNEVLIEEIQNDWLRKAAGVLARVNRRRVRKPSSKPIDVCRDSEGSYEDLVAYVELGTPIAISGQ
ncbi:MAG: hypothetical protein ACJA0N_001630, partial [Pseudohongiellaceae bacterium]